ncbi:nuclear transport factor 2 family protein [Nostoc sp.]|uniref:nuclear transport factor 2 family protein n=1 Tax=Nostoc sp. TaxID=1180 RepID=UPI002FF81ABF
MEPNLVTDPKILNVLNELIQREPIFHRPELGTTRSDFERMTEATFWEVGASGRRYSRQYVLDEMEKRYASPEQDTWQTCDFHCLEIAAENYLVTYTLIQGTRITRRSTIWRQTPQGWKIVYHQGTVVENA